MPIFEFVCSVCDQPFEDLIFSSSLEGVLCPACGSDQVQKKMSTFSSKIAGSSSSLSLGASPAASCNTGGT